jgi:putative sugar O-methyltransferase
MSRLDDMFAALRGARPEILPSKYWEELNRTNVEQLSVHGYDLFKRTLALNYFTFIVPRKDSQFRFLQEHLPGWLVARAAGASVLRGRHPGMGWRQSLLYTYHTLLIWEYARRTVRGGIPETLSEPEEGGPFSIFSGGKLISQDLANSVLEFHAITDPIAGGGGPRSVLELGAGYGRTAYVFLRLFPAIRYVVVDIPPALYVAERYLSSQFSGRKIFRFREFSNYGEIKAEFESSQIAFLLPNQAELLPPKSVDLSVNISSLHEMRMDQVRFYFDLIERLTSRWFYLKEWKMSRNPFERDQFGEDDYPVRPGWERLFHRDCAVQTEFFEALYRL